jgi:hypothetical protein
MTKPLPSERILGEFSTRKTGNSLILTVPVTAGVPEGQKFILKAKSDGSLEYVVADQNPWTSGEYDNIDFRAELNDVGHFGNESPVGKENIEW